MALVTGEWLADFFQVDTGSGNGSTVTFAASAKFAKANAIWVYVDGVKRTDYTVNMGASSVTFTTAPALGQSIELKYIKKSL